MVSDLFESLLQELAKSLQIKDLKPDPNNSCLIHFQNGLEVQIEPFEKDDKLLLVIDLGQIPKGRFREDVFRESLIANGIPSPGTFAYSDQSDHLLLMELMPFDELNGEKIAATLSSMLEKAKIWKDNLDSGAVPIAHTLASMAQTAKPFGI